MSQIVITGNLTADPELRYTPSGAPVSNFTVAVTPRRKDGDQWVDGDPAFYRVAAWQTLAENVVETLHRGDRVTVVGRLEPRTWEKDGKTGLSLDVTADEVGPSLKWATATIVKAGKGGQQKPQRQQQDAGWGAPNAGGWG